MTFAKVVDGPSTTLEFLDITLDAVTLEACLSTEKELSYKILLNCL